MRCSSTVSAPVQHCCAPLTAHCSRYVGVQLLTNEVLYFVAETKSKAKDVYTRTCIYLAGRGMLDCELFGLAILYDGEYLFVDPESKLSKYAPKNWKSSSSYGLDGYGKPTFMLHLRVQFYIDTPTLLRDEITRHNYYLQLRDNTLTRGQMTFCSSDELLFLLIGYALQADFGDYNERDHGTDYFQIEKYFPKEIINKNKHVIQTAIALHKDNRGLTAAEAEMHYIREASSNEISLLSHNLHLYKLKSHKKQSADHSAVWLAICARGIQIYEETHFKKPASTTFSWNNIGKLCFDRKKFEIKALSPTGDKMTYYTNSDEKSKHLLLLCRVTHQFSMSIQAKLSEIKKQGVSEDSEISGEIGNIPPGETVDSFSSINSRCDFSEKKYNRLTPKRGEVNEGAPSVLLPAIDSPVDVPDSSAELIGPNEATTVKLRRKSTGSSVEPASARCVENPVVFCSLSRRDLKLCLENARVEFSGESNRTEPCKTDVDCNVLNYESKKNFGMKSKSLVCVSGETVDSDVKGTDICKNDGHNELESSQENVEYLSQRHASNVSDLETSSSGVYTSSNDLNSENANGIVPTISSASEPGILANGCPNEVYDINRLKTVEKENCNSIIHPVSDSVRKRSDSNTSGESEPESFCGDGSGRLEGGKRTLLSADELSDLIVGKTHVSGTYPSKATISNTLDSDSDYVTLPLPPRYSCDNKTDLESTRCSLFSKDPHLPDMQEKIPAFLNLSDTYAVRERVIKEISGNISTASNKSTGTTVEEHPSAKSTPAPRVEANARFITTKPHVSMITHSNVPVSSLTPNYACPTISNGPFYLNNGAQTHVDIYSRLNSVSNSHKQLSLSGDVIYNVKQDFSTRGETVKGDWELRKTENTDPAAGPFAGTKNSVGGLYLMRTDKTKVPSVSTLPIIGKNNYLDIHATKSRYDMISRDSNCQRTLFTLSPLTTISSAPPPPPPPHRTPHNVAPVTVYTSQVTSSQIEQFKQQLYSDVDYVVYPMKDPAISKQEYIDAKKCSLLAAMASAYPQMCKAPPPPPYPRVENRFFYRSTPNMAVDDSFIPLKITNQFLHRYSSRNELTADPEGEYSSHVTPQPGANSFELKTSNSLADRPYGRPQNLQREILPLPYLSGDRLSDIPGKTLTLARTQSDDNILSSRNRQVCSFSSASPSPPLSKFFSHKNRFGMLDSKTKSGKAVSSSRPNDVRSHQFIKTGSGNRCDPFKCDSSPKAFPPNGDSTNEKGKIIDIRALIEKSKNLDLPLISALCNDKSLLCQTNAFVMPKHPNSFGPFHSPSRPFKNSNRIRKKYKMENEFISSINTESQTTAKFQKWHGETASKASRPLKPCKGPTLFEAIFSVKGSKRYASSKLKYPVSGLSTSQISKSHKKKSCIHSAHVHPESSETDADVSRPFKSYAKTSSAINYKRALVP